MCFEYLNHLICVPWSRPTLSNDNERLLGRDEQINSLADAAWAGAHRWWWRTVLQIPEAHQTRLTSLKSEHCSSGIYWETERGELSGWGLGGGVKEGNTQRPETERKMEAETELETVTDTHRDREKHTQRHWRRDEGRDWKTKGEAETETERGES